MPSDNNTIFFLENDDDIKIAGSSSENKKNYDENRITLAQLKAMKQDGGLDSARAAGKEIATEILGMKILKKDGQPMDELVTAQCCCLMSFGVVSGCGRYISSDIIERVVMNEFYDQLRKSDESFYNQSNDLAAMSTYYLDARRGENLEEKIGFSFASLCRQPENFQIIRLGNEIFRRCCLIVRHRLENHGVEMSEN